MVRYAAVLKVEVRRSVHTDRQLPCPSGERMYTVKEARDRGEGVLLFNSGHKSRLLKFRAKTLTFQRLNKEAAGKANFCRR